MIENKKFYEQYTDDIWAKRIHSPYPVRAYVHAMQNEAILSHIHSNEIVLDAGCGQGVLAIALAEKKGCLVTGVDLSEPNIERARFEAETRNLSSKIMFVQGDAEHIPFPDNSFDVVVSSHVLEHLPDFDQGFCELCRIARKRVIIALPTGFNLCALALLGGDYGYWRLSKRSIFAIPYGFVRTIASILRKEEGVQEGYAGHKDLPHIWRFPWIVRRRLAHPDWKIVSYEASTVCLPYFSFLLPLSSLLDHFRINTWLRYFGYGTTIVLEKKT